jgi:TRAP-type C4-dicarboxylate transport system permease small subunit
VSRFEAAVGALCLTGLIIVPGYQILARAIPALPLPLWTYDVATLFLVWLSFIGAALAEKAKTPPVVTIITDRLPITVQGVLSAVGGIVSIIIFVAIAVDAARWIPEQWSFGIGDLQLPLGLYTVALPIGAFLIAVHLFSRLRSALRLLSDRRVESPVNRADLV